MIIAVRTSFRRLMVIFMIAIIIVLLCGSCFEMPVNASSDVRIGQARRGEQAYKNNKPGDQTGKEVMISDWSYSSISFKAEHWEYVMRAKDPDKARIIAEKMADACENDYIGYDQNDSDRGSFYDAAKKNDWDITKIKKKCETTCSCAISVCLNAAGIKVPRLWMTRDMKDDMDATGEFYCFTSKKFLRSSSNLAVGDILINPGKHAVVVVESPHPYTYPVSYTSPDGKHHTAQVAENADIVLNLNNGLVDDNGMQTLKADGEIDLDEIVPEKEGFVFSGWRKTSKSSFCALYSGKMSAIGIVSEPVNIEN